MALEGLLRSTLALIGMLFALLCVAGPAGAKFDPAVFQSEKAVVLGIDLRDESNITVGLVVRDINSRKTEVAHVFLPFPSTKAMGSEQALPVWGSYNGFTYLSLVLQGSEQTHSIEVAPIIRRVAGPLDVRSIQDPITFIEDGQTRTFIYRYLSGKLSDNPASRFLRSTSLPVDAIAVAIPPDAQSLAVKPGAISDPPPYFYQNSVGFFPAVRQNSSDQLELKYFMPANENQKAFIELLVKIFALLGAPLATIALAQQINKISNSRKYIILSAGAGLQVFIFFLISTIWFRWVGATSISNIIDLVIGLLGIGVSVVVWWVVEKNNASNK